MVYNNVDDVVDDDCDDDQTCDAFKIIEKKFYSGRGKLYLTDSKIKIKKHIR